MTDTIARTAGTKKPDAAGATADAGQGPQNPYERNPIVNDSTPLTLTEAEKYTAFGCTDPHCDGHLKRSTEWPERLLTEHLGERPVHSRDFGNGVRLVELTPGEWTLERSKEVVDDTFAFATSLAAATRHLAYLRLAPEWPAVSWATEHRTDDGADEALMRSFTRNLVEPQRSVQAVLLEEWMATVDWLTPERFETIAQVWLSGNDEELNFISVQHLRESARVLEAAADEWQRLQDEQGAREGLGEPGER